MQWLELRIPPVAVLLVCMLVMQSLALYCPGCYFSFPPAVQYFLISLVFIVGSLLVVLAAVVMYRATTTVNPFCPEKTTFLVKTGVFKYSRNPVYLGLTLILLAWGIYLSNGLTLAMVLIYVWYITNFQIIPEEKALRQLFGKAYNDYCNQVGRWL